MRRSRLDPALTTPLSRQAVVSILALALATFGCGRVGYTADASIDGGGGRMDARVRDAEPVVPSDGGGNTDDACVPFDETCDGTDQDCDGRVDEGFDLRGDTLNCGACGVICPSAASSTPACNGGVCGYTCLDGFADCDAAPDTGCEANLGTGRTCGACTTSCAPPASVCERGADGFACVSACAAGLTECADACVDLATDVSNCGACGASCLLDGATTACVAGACRIVTCPPETLDCNLSFDDGCESRGVIRYTVDADGDGFGTTDSAVRTCIESMGVASGGDCDDADPNTFPRQPLFFERPRGDGTFDYDCNGVDQPQWRTMGLCAEGPTCMLVEVGWVLAAIPGCGESGTWMGACTGSAPACALGISPRTQHCH